MKKYFAVALAMFTAATANAALVGRDINGNAVTARDGSGMLDPSAVFLYDNVLDVTWLRNARASGELTWDQANSWVASLAIGNYGGWRLPTMIDTGAAGCDFASFGTDCGYWVQTKSGNLTQYERGQTVYSEMAHLFYVTLNSYVGLYQTGDFLLVPHRDTWFGLEYAPDPTMVWDFNPSDGSQGGPTAKTNHLHAMAVRDGDVAPAAVPEPQTLALVLLALVAMVGAAARRRKAA